MRARKECYAILLSMIAHEQIKEWFASCPNADAKYQKIIELGRALPQLAPEYRIAENQVPGCQSILYLRSFIADKKFTLKPIPKRLFPRVSQRFSFMPIADSQPKPFYSRPRSSSKSCSSPSPPADLTALPAYGSACSAMP